MYAKIASRYAAEFRDASMSREFAEAVLARYKVDGTDLPEIPSLAEPCIFVSYLNAEPASNVLDRTKDVEDS